jgi:hypothetical protein
MKKKQIELFVKMLSQNEQQETLDFICNLSIENRKKAKHIQRMILEETITNGYVIQYFSEKKLEDLASEFYSLDDIKKRKLNVVSGSEWTEQELEYFKVVFFDTTNPKDICNIRENIGAKANTFLEINSALDEATFAVEESNMGSRAQNDFQRKIMLCILNPSKESCIDTMMQSFLENVLNDRFCIEPRYKMPLQISNRKKEATADIVAILFPQTIVGLIIVEDKPEDSSNTEKQYSDAESQMVAEAIAIAQQDYWNMENPIYMLRVLKTYITIYKAEFTKEFISCVKTGTTPTLPVTIIRLCPPPKLNIGRIRPGFNILNRQDRRELVKVISSVGNDITDRIPP